MKVSCLDFHGNKHMVDETDLIDRTSAYGVYIDDDHVLLVKNMVSDLWELPGGGIEPKETIEDALRREFTEETGLTIYGEVSLVFDFKEHYFDLVSNQAWKSHRNFYRIFGAKGKILKDGNSDDIKMCRMISIQGIDERDVMPKTKDIINAAL